MFYVDVEGHLTEPRMQSALAGLAGVTQFLRVLGCYPRAIGAASGSGASLARPEGWAQKALN